MRRKYKRLGVNGYPRDIEEVIVKHEAVQETAVFGIPSDKWGETPLAAIILKSGATIDEEALKNWVNERVGARYQRLHVVVFTMISLVALLARR